MTIALPILLCSAFLCLVLEISRFRSCVVYLAISAIALSTFILINTEGPPTDPITISAFATLGILTILLANSQFYYANKQRGEAYALILAIYSISLCIYFAVSLIQLAVLVSLSNMLFTGLAYFRGNKRIASEIAIKFQILSLFTFCLLCLSIVISSGDSFKLGQAFTWISILLLVGAAPFLNVHVDYLDGAPAFAAVMLIGSILLSVGSFLYRLLQIPLEPGLFQIILGFSVVCLLAPPLLALDQQRIGRALAYLCMSQVGIMLLLCLLQVGSISVFFLHIALAMPGAFAGVRFWKHAKKSDKNWEDYAGAGRKHPYVSLCWLFILSSLAGAPLTLGFWLQLEIVQAAKYAQLEWILALVENAIVLAMIPVVRLGVFMFAKPTGYEMTRLHQPRQGFLVITCAVLVLIAKFICYWLPTAYELKVFSP